MKRRHFLVHIRASMTAQEKLPDLNGIDPDHHKSVLLLAAQMQQQGYRREDPVRSTLVLLGDRWSTLILLVLEMGVWRHAELRRVLGRLGSEERISQRVLTQKLRTLEREGLVTRHATNSVPPKVTYELTPLGEELQTFAKTIIAWSSKRSHDIVQSRKIFDELLRDSD